MGYITEPHQQQMDPYHPPLRPAPIALVAVRHRTLEALVLLRAFLDTGADRSKLAPHSLAIMEKTTGTLPITLGEAGQDPCIFFDLGFSWDGGVTWFYPDTEVQYALSQQEYPWEEDVIIGRDLLAQFEFCCNGPESEFSLRHPDHC